MSINALKNVIVITPVISIWSGQVTLKRDELRSVTGLPPSHLVSDGAKKVIDPKALTRMESRRRCANRDLARMGNKSPIGYQVLPEHESEVLQMLDEHRTKFEEAKTELVFNYDSLCQQWEAQHPEFADLLRRNRPTARQVGRACDFDYAMYRVTEVESEVGRKQFEAVAKASAGSLAEDIASTASQIFTQSFKGKATVTQRAVNTVRDLITKLRGFSMFDPRIDRTADALDMVLKDIPRTGPLDVSQTLVLGVMLQSMTDPQRLLELGVGTSADDEEEALDITPSTTAIGPDPQEVAPETTTAADGRSEMTAYSVVF